MFLSPVLRCSRKRVSVAAALLSGLLTGPAAWASPPTPFVMTTDIVFPPGSGVFVVHEPAWICPTGTFENLSELDSPPQAGAFVVTGVVRYTCDDGSGTFVIQLHPQWNYGTQGGGFTLSGPWSVLPGGTGAYRKLRGHGTLGFDVTGVDEETGEVFGVESFAGHVQGD